MDKKTWLIVGGLVVFYLLVLRRKGSVGEAVQQASAATTGAGAVAALQAQPAPAPPPTAVIRKVSSVFTKLPGAGVSATAPSVTSSINSGIDRLASIQGAGTEQACLQKGGNATICAGAGKVASLGVQQAKLGVAAASKVGGAIKSGISKLF